MKRHYEQLKLNVELTSNEDILTSSLGVNASPSMKDGYFYYDWDYSVGADE